MAPALALKLLSGAWRDDDDPVRRLRDEARLLARLRHPGIVRLYSFVRLDAGPGLLMELVEGPNLNEVLKATGRLPHAAALELVAAVAEALTYAWELPGDEGQPLHLLHRDIKPANLAVTRHGEVKLLDFGIAWGAFEAREARSGPEPRGTGTYMPPERVRGQDSPTVDVYGLGLVLANLLTGEPHPELPKDQEAQEGFRRALSSQLLRALGSRLRLHEMIASLVLSCVEWAPEDRPSPADLAELARALAGESSGPGLKVWALATVPVVLEQLEILASAEPMVGAVLVEHAPGAAGAPRRARVVGELDEEEPSAPTWLSDPAPRPWAAPVQVTAPEISATPIPLVVPAAVVPIVPARRRPPWAAVLLAALVLISLSGFSLWWMLWGPRADRPAERALADTLPAEAPAPAPADPPAAPPEPTPPAAPVATAAPGSAEATSRRRLGRRAPVTSVTPASRASVTVQGDATRVELRAGDQTLPLPAEIAPGTYSVIVTFPNGDRPFVYSELVASAGRAYEITCRASMLTCRTRELP